MILNLRILAMLDSGPSVVSHEFNTQEERKLKRMQKAASLCLKTITRAPAFKAHKVGYQEEDEEVSETRRMINNMAMNDRN
jgi:hypothetical protein